MPIQITHKSTVNQILVLGAGKLGCQALQHLANCALANASIKIIDLEPNDVQGLQQQIIRKNDFIGRSRAELACDAITATNPNVQIKATNYGIGYFQMFDLVLNALENRSDRIFLNFLCLSAGIPIIDCYECADKLTGTYPVDCIQNAPTDFIHCVIWAERLFNQLFGKIDENDIQQLARNENYDCAILFKRLFYDDAMKNVEKNVQHTIPIPYKAFTNDMQPVNQTAIKREVNTMWTSDEGQAVFTTSLVEIHKKITSPKTNDHSEWMQNDEAAVDFIIASAKLRAINFHIPQKSYLETKLVLCLKAPKKPDLPNESLEGIFTNCDDKTLLCASRVCKQFRSVVEGVFERRYSNKPYEIYTDGLTDEDAPSLPFRQFHRAILINFGSKFCWIITQINNISWFADILKKNGTNLKILTVIPSIAIHPLLQEPHDLGQVFSQLPSLTELNLCRAMLQSNWPKYDMPNLKHYNVHATFYENEKEFYAKFFTHNTQIETISAREVGDENMLRAMSGHLNHLKTLHIQDYFPPQDELDVSLHSLETLSLSNDEIQLKIRDALRPFQRGCKNIKRLKIVECATMEDNDVSAIVSFEKITSLKIEVEDIKITHLRLIEYQLPNLSFFSLTTQLNDENNDNRASDIDKILSMISKCKCLTKLHVKTQKDYFEQMNATFHSRFLKAIGAKRQQFVLTLTYVPVPTSLMTVTKEKITWSGDDDLSPPVVVYQAE